MSTIVCVILVLQSATCPVPPRLLVLGAARLAILPTEVGFTPTLGETSHLLCWVLGSCCLKCLFTYVLDLLHNKIYTSIYLLFVLSYICVLMYPFAHPRFLPPLWLRPFTFTLKMCHSTMFSGSRGTPHLFKAFQA